MTATRLDMPPEALRNELSYNDGKLFWINKRATKSVYKAAGSYDNKGYIHIRFTHEGVIRSYKAHRIVYWLHTGEWPETVDHINGVRDDNRIENLRAATQSENNFNRVQFNQHGYPHVTLKRGKWVAQVRVNGKIRSVCDFSSKHEAAAAADILNYKVNGEFATFGLLSVDEIKAIIKGDRDEAQRIIQQAILLRCNQPDGIKEAEE